MGKEYDTSKLFDLDFVRQIATENHSGAHAVDVGRPNEVVVDDLNVRSRENSHGTQTVHVGVGGVDGNNLDGFAFFSFFQRHCIPAFQLRTTQLNQIKSVRRLRPSWSKTSLLNEKGGSFPEQAPYPLLQACPESLPFAATGEASRRIN